MLEKRRLVTVLALSIELTGSACAVFRAESGPTLPDEAGRHGAALSTLIVNNRTPFALQVGYRGSAPPVREVVLGEVAAGARVRLAPIPAGEPILLIARKSDGAELSLPARSYPINDEWVWEIHADAPFLKR